MMTNITSIHKYQQIELSENPTPKKIIEKFQKLLSIHMQNSYKMYWKSSDFWEGNISNDFDEKIVLQILDTSDFCFDSHIQQVDEIYELTQSWKNILIEMLMKYEIIFTLEKMYEEKFDFWELNDLLRQINPFLEEKIEIKQEYSPVDLDKLEKQFWKDEYEEYEILEYRIWKYLENYLEYSNEFKMNKSEIQVLLDAFKFWNYNEIISILNKSGDSLTYLFKEVQNKSIWNLRHTVNLFSIALNQEDEINKKTFDDLKNIILEWISKIIKK